MGTRELLKLRKEFKAHHNKLVARSNILAKRLAKVGVKLAIRKKLK